MLLFSFYSQVLYSAREHNNQCESLRDQYGYSLSFALSKVVYIATKLFRSQFEETSVSFWGSTEGVSMRDFKESCI